jgi:hypothetical protein
MLTHLHAIRGSIETKAASLKGNATPFRSPQRLLTELSL